MPIIDAGHEICVVGISILGRFNERDGNTLGNGSSLLYYITHISC